MEAAALKTADAAGCEGSVSVGDAKDSKILSVYIGIACSFAAFGLLFPGSSPWKNKLEEAEKSELARKVEAAEAEVEEMKKRRSEDAKANEKVAAMFAARTQQWKSEKNKLAMKVEKLLSHSQAVERSPCRCLECVRKEEVIWDLEAKSQELKQQLVRAYESCQRECKIIVEEKEEIKRSLSSEIVKLQKDVEEKGEILCALLRKSEEKEELDRDLAIAELKRKQGDWTGFEKSVHAAHIKQRHLQEVDAFERQMRAKDERMEAFRQKLLVMENMTEKLQAENERLIQSLEQVKEKTTIFEVLLKEKDLSLEDKKNASCQCQHALNKLEDPKNKQENVEGTNFNTVQDAEAEHEEKEFRSSVVEAVRIRPRTHYKNQEERLRSLLVTNDSMPKTYLNSSKFVGKHSSYCDNRIEGLLDKNSEERDYILPVGDVHLRYLIEEATKAFNSGCKVKGTEDESIEKPGFGSLLYTYKLGQCGSDPENNHPEDLPTVIDKHVSETVNCSTGMHNPAEAKVFDPVKLQPGLGLLGEWRKGREIALGDSECQAVLLGQIRQIKGKTVFDDRYLAYKKLGTTLEIVHSEKEAKGQFPKQSNDQLQTVPDESFLESKDDHFSFDANSYLKHILQGRDSSWKEVEVLAVSSEVKSLEEELLQLEKVAKTEASKGMQSKDGEPIMNMNTENGIENRHVESIHGPLTAIRFLKKQVKRYQAVIGKIDDLCRRMNDKDPLQTIRGSRTREQIAVQELFLMETFELQHCVVAMGQKLMAIQSNISRNSCALKNNLPCPPNFNIRQSIVIIKSHLQDIQRSLEIKLARIIGDLEGTLARDGILHVMPLEWKKEDRAMSGKGKNGNYFSKVKQ